MSNGSTELGELADNKVRTHIACSVSLCFLKHTTSRHTGMSPPFPGQEMDLIVQSWELWIKASRQTASKLYFVLEPNASLSHTNIISHT